MLDNTPQAPTRADVIIEVQRQLIRSLLDQVTALETDKALLQHELAAANSRASTD